ncbi:galactose-1-phosphate uridylyltransferase [Candidatus Aerophobetes bacterium]|uniref:Galactose-1-phosphate uridylyltransferase n=1 Tax=Aerophobetes bacterium TaxID=2030807 RepID=A0A662D633_UNCAE|nr:MAG: galactose-1-phosphate uridylyltransferase [Candidatus Aerophobetes bacterium]
MSELRQDPLTGGWVIISPRRNKRPFDFVSETKEEEATECSFCEGHENETPPEILSLRKKGTRPNTPGWWIRVVPNKYPALQLRGKANVRKRGIYKEMEGVGAHEVIIETPEHKEDLFSLEDEHIRKVIEVYRDRIVKLTKIPYIKYVLVFKNQGREAGASLRHSHSQVIATPIIPRNIQEELEGAKRYYELNKRCIFCDIMAQELALRKRVILENEMWVAFTPYASRFPYEICLLPKEHTFIFQEMTDEELAHLSQILRDVIRAMNKALSNPPYNYFLHLPPLKKGSSRYYHFHLEIIPRLTKLAGFEWGTGFYINPVPPEEAAAKFCQG